MSHSLAGPFAPGATLTSTAANTIDQNAKNSVDNTTAGDTILGPITFSGASSSCTFASTSTTGLVIASGGKLTCNGTATMGSGSSLTVPTTCTSSIQVGSGSLISCTGGAIFSVANTCAAQVVLGSGSYVQTQNGSSGQIQLGNGGVTTSDIKFLSVQSKVVVTHGASVVTMAGGPNAVGSIVQFGDSVHGPAVNSGSFIAAVVNTTNNNPYSYLLPIRNLHNGSTLSSIALHFLPNGVHAGQPGSLPAFGVYRDALDGSTIGQALIGGAGYVQFAWPGSVGAYEARQTLTLTTTINNVVDTQGWVYYAVVWDEAGTNALAGTKYFNVACTCSSIQDMRFA